MAKKTRTELSTLAVNTNLPDNTQELITPTTERAQLTDERESVVNYKDDLGGTGNAGKFLTVAVDGESFTMVNEPSGVPDWVTFLTATVNQMLLKAGGDGTGTSQSTLKFTSYDGATTAQINFNGIDGNFYVNGANSQIQLTNAINFIIGGTPRLTISSGGDVNIKSVRTDGIVNIQAKDTNAYGGLNVSSFGNDNTWLSMTHDGTRGIIGQTYGSGGGYTPLVLRTSDQDRLTIASNGNISTNPSPDVFAITVNGNATTSQSLGLDIKAGTNGADISLRARSFGGTDLFTVFGNGSAAFSGSVSKASGSFKIDHPLESKKETHHLVHSFVESPQANNIYRGKVDLVNGTAHVNLDEVSKMTEGTFILLNTNIHCYTSNETNWDSVKGSVKENILTIECQNNKSNASVNWLVIGERHDIHMLDTDWTDEKGKVIVEPLKQE